MFTDRDTRRDRLLAILPVVAIHVAFGLVLLRGLQPGMVQDEPEPLKLVRLPPPEQVLPDLQPPPPPPPADGRAPDQTTHAAEPPGHRARERAASA